MSPEALGKICSIGVFFGFNLTFLPQFVMGSRGMPRRYWDYDPQYEIFHQLSTIGAFVLGISLFITVIYLFASFWNGKKAVRNPWGGSSLEWQAPTPPTLYNFEKPPVLHELYNYDDIIEVEPDVWVRRSPIEEEPARADKLAAKDAAKEEVGSTHQMTAEETAKAKAAAAEAKAKSEADAKKADAEKAAAEKAEIDKAEKAAAEKAASVKAEAEKAEKATAEKAAADKAAAEAAEKAAAEKAPAEKAAAEKAAAEKAAAEAAAKAAEADAKAKADAEAADKAAAEAKAKADAARAELLAKAEQIKESQSAKPGLTQGWDVPEVPDDAKLEGKVEEAPKPGLTQGWDVPAIPDDEKDKK
jgi:hypothetical protein